MIEITNDHVQSYLAGTLQEQSVRETIRNQLKTKQGFAWDHVCGLREKSRQALKLNVSQLWKNDEVEIICSDFDPAAGQQPKAVLAAKLVYDVTRFGTATKSSGAKPAAITALGGDRRINAPGTAAAGADLNLAAIKKRLEEGHGISVVTNGATLRFEIVDGEDLVISLIESDKDVELLMRLEFWGEQGTKPIDEIEASDGVVRLPLVQLSKLRDKGVKRLAIHGL